MIRPPILACLALALLGACAGAPRTDSRVAAPAPLTSRVASILAHRHISPPASPALLSARLFDQLRATLGCSLPASPELARERERLLDHLERGDVSFVQRTALACGVPAPSRERELPLVLQALARAYDPHSRYLTADALLRFQAQAHLAGEAAPSARLELVEHAGQRIGVVHLPSFYLRSTRSASGDLRRACLELRARDAQALVLDLRGNGGGVQREAVLAFGVLAGGGAVAQLRRRDHEPELLRAPADLLAWTGPLLVLVDGGTASVAELLAAALQDHGRALVLGQRTYGKGTGQTLVHLGSPRDVEDGAVDVTDRRFYRIDGRPLQREGVTPDLGLPGPTRASERSQAEALLGDWIAPVMPTRGFREPQPSAGSAALHAAIEYVQQSMAETNATPP